MNITKIALSLLLPPLICAGCIKENNGECPSGLYVTFETRNPKHNYVEAAGNVDLYFYTPDGTLEAQYNYAKDDLRAFDGAAFVPDPPQGEFLLMAIVNNGADVNSVDTDDYATIRSEFKSSLIEKRLTDYFSAEKRITVDRRDNATEMMVLDKYNNDIRLNVEYDGYVPPAGTGLEAYITCNNGVYQFNTRKCLDPCLVRYQPWAAVIDSGTGIPKQFTISTMHIWQAGSDKGKCDVTIFLHETGLPMDTGRTVAVNLTDELLKIRDPQTGELLYDTDAKLLFEDEYELSITLGSEFKILALTINDWAIIEGGVDL